MELRKCIFTKNACYIAGKPMTPKGVMWHSTGANNPNLKRYVGPDDGFLGYNSNCNHWNTYKPGGVSVCVHAFIGLDKTGAVATYQTLPFDMRGWHAGGSANDSYIGFEICEDGLGDRSYFERVYKEAVEFTAYLCKTYGLDPMGKNVIICHQDGAKLGIASNHADIYHWFNRYGKTMDDVRADVKALIGGSSATKPSKATTTTKANTDYSLKDFIKEVQGAIGAKVDGIAGPETLSKTVTVSASKNNRHKVVSAIQKRVNALGYDAGEVDGIAGKLFTSAIKKYQSANGCVSDGEVTAKAKTWRKLLGME